MVFLDVPMMQQPEAYIGGAANLFDESGAVANAGTRKFFGVGESRKVAILVGPYGQSVWSGKPAFVDAYAAWVEKIISDYQCVPR